MCDEPQRAVILIPSLEPDDRLPAYVDRLLARGFQHVLIVDDGSPAPYQPIFQALSEREGCTVLHHDVNHGKGVALKTGYAYIEKNMPDCTGVITADADGQHTVQDCWKLAEELARGERALYLGSRDFNLPNIPPKSRFGNKTTSLVFRLFYGQYLPDTQTGLRAFRREDLGFMQEVEGERFEYEMNVLIACAIHHLPMIPVGIETVYENENAGTHFHPVRDSFRIYRVILGNFFRFMGSSIFCFLLDNAIFTLLEQVFLPLTGVAAVTIATVVARCISAPCNFLLNRQLVFKVKSSPRRAALRYALLVVTFMLLSALGVNLLSLLGVPDSLDSLSKIIIDTILYLLNYRIQRSWVFGPDKEANA